MRSPSPFDLAAMAWNRWNMRYSTLRLYLRRTCKPGLSAGKHTILKHVKHNAWWQIWWPTEKLKIWLKKTDASLVFQFTSPTRGSCRWKLLRDLFSVIQCFLTVLWYSRISWNISFLPNLAANVSGVRPWLFLTNGSPRILCFLWVAWKNMSYKTKRKWQEKSLIVPGVEEENLSNFISWCNYATSRVLHVHSRVA